MAKQPFYGWTNVVICFLCYFLVYGIVFYGFSVIFPVMVKTMGWKRGDASIAQTMRVLVMGFGSPLAGYIIARWSVRAALLSGGLLITVALIFLGTGMNQLWQWIVVWGFVIGFGMALCGLVSVQSSVAYWFNMNRGMAMGIVMSGAAVGGFLGQPLFTWIMKQAGSWQIGWLSAAAFAFLGAVVVIGLKNKPADFGQHQDGISPEDAMAASASGRRNARTYRTKVQWTLAEAIRTRQLWCMIVCTSVAVVPLYMMVTHGVFHWTGKGLTAMQAAYVLSFNVLGSACGRFPAGWLGDRIEARWILTLEFILIVCTTVVFWQAPSITMLIVAAFVFGFFYGSGLVLIPTLVANYYGSTNFPQINSFMYPFQYGIASAVPVLAGYIYDYTKSYDIAWTIVLVMGFISIACAFLSTPPRKETSVQGPVLDKITI